jgi:outer membrane protein insertion porin family
VAAAQVRANPELKGVVATGANTLPQVVVEEAFRDQYGRTLNFRAFKDSLGKVNRWYEERGIFGQVLNPAYAISTPRHPAAPVV